MRINPGFSRLVNFLSWAVRIVMRIYFCSLENRIFSILKGPQRVATRSPTLGKFQGLMFVKPSFDMGFWGHIRTVGLHLYVPFGGFQKLGYPQNGWFIIYNGKPYFFGWFGGTIIFGNTYLFFAQFLSTGRFFLRVIPLVQLQGMHRCRCRFLLSNIVWCVGTYVCIYSGYIYIYIMFTGSYG